MIVLSGKIAVPCSEYGWRALLRVRPGTLSLHFISVYITSDFKNGNRFRISLLFTFFFKTTIHIFLVWGLWFMFEGTTLVWLLCSYMHDSLILLWEMQMCPGPSRSSDLRISWLPLFVEVEKDAHQLDLIVNVVDTGLLLPQWVQLWVL